MKTPIFIDLKKELNSLTSNEFNLNEEDPLDIYLDPNAVLPTPIPLVNTTLPYILAPRYYLLIKSPLDQNLPTLKIKIHKSDTSLLKNKARILLEPSLTYGINSCYTVEYWEWVPNLNLTADISKKKLKTEYWFVPILDNNYAPHQLYYLKLTECYSYNPFYYSYYNYSKLSSEKVDVERTVNVLNGTVEDIITDAKYSHIFSFPLDNYLSFQENIITENFNYNEETKKWNFSKALTESTLIRKSNEVDGALLDGPTSTTIEYISPFNPAQLNLYL